MVRFIDDCKLRNFEEADFITEYLDHFQSVRDKVRILVKLQNHRFWPTRVFDTTLPHAQCVCPARYLALPAVFPLQLGVETGSARTRREDLLRPHAIIPANPRAYCAVRRRGADALLYTWLRCCCCRLTCICEERWADRSMNPCISKMSSTYVDSGRSLSRARAFPLDFVLPHSLPHSLPPSLLLAHTHDDANFLPLCLLLVAVIRVSSCIVRGQCGMLRAGEPLREGFRVHPIPDSGC
jgi:hypothetical protein